MVRERSLSTSFLFDCESLRVCFLCNVSAWRHCQMYLHSGCYTSETNQPIQKWHQIPHAHYCATLLINNSTCSSFHGNLSILHSCDSVLFFQQKVLLFFLVTISFSFFFSHTWLLFNSLGIAHIVFAIIRFESDSYNKKKYVFNCDCRFLWLEFAILA